MKKLKSVYENVGNMFTKQETDEKQETGAQEFFS